MTTEKKISDTKSKFIKLEAKLRDRLNATEIAMKEVKSIRASLDKLRNKQ